MAKRKAKSLEPKSLGQIMYEADGGRGWERLSHVGKKVCDRVAAAVEAEVMRRLKLSAAAVHENEAYDLIIGDYRMTH